MNGAIGVSCGLLENWPGSEMMLVLYAFQHVVLLAVV
jgi:hypothetical protein